MSDADNMELSASLEDYLEAIFRIVELKQAARATDIGKRLNVGRSSVTGALRALAARDLINYAPYDIVTLTPKGTTVAEDVVRRHEVLHDFFVRVLAVDHAAAETAACKMEHAIPETILQRFLGFIEFVDRCPRGGDEWIRGFGAACHQADDPDACARCVKQIEKTVWSRKMGQTKPADVTTLASLKPGQKASIIKITAQGSIRRRLLDMGATAGTLVEVERIAPLGDPIEIKVKGYHLTLRKEEARSIAVENVPL